MIRFKLAKIKFIMKNFKILSSEKEICKKLILNNTIMKFILLLLPFLCFSQEDNSCKDMSIRILQMAYNSESNFNTYRKDKNAYVDVDYQIEANYELYNRLWQQTDEKWIASSKESMFNILRTMNKTGFFNNSDLPECSFYKVIFNTTYVTSDRKRIKFQFSVQFQDMASIKDSFNRQDALLYLMYLGKQIE